MRYGEYSAREFVLLFNALPAKEQRAFLQAIQGRNGSRPPVWLTYESIANRAELSRSQVCRYVRKGLLWTNRKTGRHIRVASSSANVLLRHLERERVRRSIRAL